MVLRKKRRSSEEWEGGGERNSLFNTLYFELTEFHNRDVLINNV